MSTLETLQDMLQGDFDLAREALHAEATLESLDIDSLRMIEILFGVEEAFAITVPAEQADLRRRIRTLGDLAAYVDELVAAKHGAGREAAP